MRFPADTSLFRNPAPVHFSQAEPGRYRPYCLSYPFCRRSIHGAVQIPFLCLFPWPEDLNLATVSKSNPFLRICQANSAVKPAASDFSVEFTKKEKIPKRNASLREKLRGAEFAFCLCSFETLRKIPPRFQQILFRTAFKLQLGGLLAAKPHTFPRGEGGRAKRGRMRNGET